MRCPACSYDNADGRQTCEKCGTSLGRCCHVCGQHVPLEFKFCGHCGAAQQLGAGSDAERRQLTVLFCDLVNSTAYAQSLDPEDLRDAMRAYYALCEEVAAHFDGQISEIAGDGVVISFGFPRAYEDAAERAVRAGLGLTQAIGQLRPLPSMQVRIGIATGTMIVGDVIEMGGARERELVGSTVHLAARLQGIAAPNTVVVSESTRSLVGGVFVYEDLGQRDIKGFSEQVQVYAIAGENVAADRFEAHAGPALLPMVDREPERALLLERWRRVKDGCGQVVWLSGEPGIGKSRLVRDLREQISESRPSYLGYAGSPLHQHTMLHPIVHQLRLATNIGSEDTLEVRRVKLERLFEHEGVRGPERLSLIAELLGSPASREEVPSDPDPVHRKMLLLEVIAQLFESHASRGPLLLVFEDAQWIDATTRELLDRLVRQVESLSILLVVTVRPTVVPQWHSLPQVTSLVLAPLEAEACARVVRGVLLNRILPEGFAEEIIARTDGVPLFLEELTKAVLEAQGRQALSNDSTKFTVPVTLRDTLMARLDRDHDARLVAQIAAVIGREFSYELLAMIVPMPAAALHAALNELLQSGLIFQEGQPPRAAYLFKHALVQEVAYESQLRRRRRSIHGQIGLTLDKHFPDTPPEVIGYHYAEAGATAPAIAHYERAAEIARGRSANAEGVEHFGRALELLATLPPGTERDQHELDLQIAYGALQIAVKGNAADEVGRAYRQALTLANEIGSARQVFRVLRGLQTFYMVRGQLPKARPIGERLLDEARRTDDDGLLLQAYRPHGLCLLYMGDLAAARDHLERAVSLYDPVKHADHRFLYGSDPGVLAYCNLAWAEWFLGLSEQALSHSERALELSEQPEPHPHSKAFALSLAASLHQFRRDADRARRLAETVIDLADLHSFAYWGPWGHVIRGWARVSMGQGEVGVEEIRSGLAAYRATGAELMRPYFLGLLADALQRVGSYGDGLAAVDEALKLADVGDIRFYEPELRCVRAELLASAGASIDARLACLQQALATASGQQSRVLELRVLIALCREDNGSQERTWALDRLREVIDGFAAMESSTLVAEGRAVLDLAAN